MGLGDTAINRLKPNPDAPSPLCLSPLPGLTGDPCLSPKLTRQALLG